MALTEAQKRLTLTIRGDPDGNGPRNAVFEMPVGDEDGLSVTHEKRTGFLARGGGTINALQQGVTGSSESKNRQIVVEGGESQFVLTASFLNFSGSDYQWGDTGDGNSKTDATGETAIEQAQTLMYWLNRVPVDSLPENLAGDVTGSYGPAQLEYGRHHETDGPYDPLDVAIENPQLTPEAGGIARGEITFVEILSLGDSLDSQNNSKAGAGR